MTIDLRAARIQAVVLDIEGTTTPIAFVYEVLFPFVRRHLGQFLAENWDSERVRHAVDRLRHEWTGDVRAGEKPPAWPDAAATQAPAALEPYVEWLMDRDRKSSGLKLLQGLVWERGYLDGALRSEIFPDVAPALRRWREAGVEISIYSSGSVLAQRLLFGHTAAGDLTPWLSGFFDTAVGAKTESGSYRRIAEALGQAPGSLLFISDVARELEAASSAGWHVLLCRRPGNTPQPDYPAGIIEDFAEVSLR